MTQTTALQTAALSIVIGISLSIPLGIVVDPLLLRLGGGLMIGFALGISVELAGP